MAGRGNRAQGKQEATVVFFHSYEGQNKVRGEATLKAFDNVDSISAADLVKDLFEKFPEQDTRNYKWINRVIASIKDWKKGYDFMTD